MIIKYGSAKILAKYASTVELLDKVEEENKLGEKYEKILANYEPIRLDKERFYYIRNRSVSSIETWGPNDNGDGFPRIELEKNHKTFINSRVSVDHQDNIIIGMVIDSVFIPPKVVVQGGKIYKTGDYVENILAIDKKAAEAFNPELIEWLEEGKVTDTSMGAIVGYSICSIPTCLNKASTPEEYCVHIANYKNNMIAIAGDLQVKAYEICRDVRFFEDSIIIPLELGGLAGGRGADPSAKILQKIASVNSLREYIIFLDKEFIKTAEEDKNTKVIEKNFDDNDIARTVERIENDFKEDFLKKDKVEVEEKEDGVKSKVIDYILQLIKEGMPYDEAIKAGETYYNKLLNETKGNIKNAVNNSKNNDNAIVVDFDNTIHKDGIIRKAVVERIKNYMDEKGIFKVYFVTGNNDINFIKKIIKLAFGECLDEIDYEIITYPHDNKETEDIAKWKADIKKLKDNIVAVFDDNPVIIEEIKKVFPNIEVIMPAGGKPKKEKKREIEIEVEE